MEPGAVNCYVQMHHGCADSSTDTIFQWSRPYKRAGSVLAAGRGCRVRLHPWDAIAQRELSRGSDAHPGPKSPLRRELWFGQTSKHHREPVTFTEFFQVTVTEPSVGRMAFLLSGLLPCPAACQPASASAPTGAELALGPSFLPFRQSLSWARDEGAVLCGRRPAIDI